MRPKTHYLSTWFYSNVGNSKTPSTKLVWSLWRKRVNINRCHKAVKQTLRSQRSKTLDWSQVPFITSRYPPAVSGSVWALYNTTPTHSNFLDTVSQVSLAGCKHRLQNFALWSFLDCWCFVIVFSLHNFLALFWKSWTSEHDLDQSSFAGLYSLKPPCHGDIYRHGCVEVTFKIYTHK